jgi:MraZ protein
VEQNYIRLLKEKKTTTTVMTFFTSEYECKLDVKGRIALPSRIKAQLPEGEQELVIRRGFEPCLILYPMVEFKKVFSAISGLSEFSKENRDFQRSFLSGVVTVELDGSGRFLVPRNLLTYGNLDKEVLLVGTGSKVEIWDPATYRKNLISDPGDLSKLAEKYLNS